MYSVDKVDRLEYFDKEYTTLEEYKAQLDAEKARS